jgi:hypothetical protein
VGGNDAWERLEEERQGLLSALAAMDQNVAAHAVDLEADADLFPRLLPIAADIRLENALECPKPRRHKTRHGFFYRGGVLVPNGLEHFQNLAEDVDGGRTGRRGVNLLSTRSLTSELTREPTSGAPKIFSSAGARSRTTGNS